MIIKGTIGSDSNASGYWCVGISGSTGCHAGTFDKHSASFSETISLGSGYTRQQMIEKELYAWVYAYSSNGWWRSEVNYANSAYFYNVPLENYSGDTITLNFSQMMLGRDNFTQNQNGLKTWTGSSLSCEDQYNNGKNTATSAKPTDGTYAAYLNYTPSFVYAKTLTVYLPYDTSNLADKNVACINSKYLDDPNNNGRLIKNSSVQPYWASFQVTPQIMSGLYQASLQQNTKILYAFIGNEKSKYSLSLYLTNNFLGYTGNNIAWQDIDSTNPKIILPKMQLIPGSYSSGGNQRSNSFASLFGYRCESVFQ